MTTVYAIAEDRQPMNGEFYDHAGVLRASVYASSGSAIIAFDLDEVLRDGAGSVRLVTEGIVREAHDAGWHDEPEFDRERLAGDFYSFPLGRDDALSSRGDDTWKDGASSARRESRRTAA